MIKTLMTFSLLAVTNLTLSGCASYIASAQYQPQPRANEYVPQSFMPPAGQCRIWYNDRKPEQQPASGDCRTLEQQVPANARLVRG